MSKQKPKLLSSAAGYNLAAESYDDKEKYLNSFEKNQLIPLLGEVKGKKILDVGAGTGRVSVPLAKAGADVVALDASEAMLKKLKSKIKIETVVADGEDLPFDSGTFDCVVAAFFIVHLKNPARFFDEAYRVLKDGGLLVVTNINQKDPPEVKTKAGSIIIESYYHRPEKIREMLESLAFGITEEKIIKEKDMWVNQIIVAQK